MKNQIVELWNFYGKIHLKIYGFLKKTKKMVRCQRCKEDFRDTYDLNRHLEKVTPCVLNIPTKCICQWCDKQLSRSDSLKRHLQICKYREEQRPVQTPVNDSSNNIVGNDNTINNGTIDNRINITINVVGKESIEHIPIEKIVEILREIDTIYEENEPYLRASALITMFDKCIRDKPENCNVDIPAHRSTAGKIKTHQGWESRPVGDIVNTLIKNTALCLTGLTTNLDKHNQRVLQVPRIKRTWGMVGDLARRGVLRVPALPGERRTFRSGFRVGLTGLVVRRPGRKTPHTT
jgi:hypothetical protein